MSDCEDGDVDVESSEDVPDIGEEATATTTNGIMYRGGSHDKRAHHNALERRRRDHIKDSFHGLRDCIPSLVGEKVSRAHILNKATEYIRHMQKGGSTREDDICDLARKNEILEEQVNALDDARSCGSPFNAEELLQSIASKVQARQAQEIMIQQLQASKANSKPSRQQKGTVSKPSSTNTTTSSSTTNNTAVTSAQTTTNTAKPKNSPAPKSADTPPTSGSSPLTLPPNMNLLASNLKSTQSLLSVLQKNLSPNSNLPPNIKSLAARVLASPLVRGVQKTTQAAAIPRGIVTATTVPKGSTPAAKAPPPSSSSSSVTPTHTATTGTNISGGSLLAKLGGVANKPAPKPAAPAPAAAGGGGGVGDVVVPDVPSLPLGGTGGGVVSPSLLTSQLLEAHNLLQQQGTALTNNIHAPSAELSVVQEGSESVAASNHTMQSLGISPELLAQVSSFLNFPPAVSAAAPSAAPVPSSSSAGNAPSLSQGSSVHALLSQTTPIGPSPSSNSHKRPSSPNEPGPPAKKPHVEQ